GLVIRLVGVGEVEPADVDLVRRIAASVQIPAEPAMEHVAQVELPGGIRAVPPEGFDLIHPDDPQATERLLRAADKTDWRSINLIPAILLPKDGAAAIGTMLSAYDSQWSEATIKEQSPRNWRIDPQDTSSASAMPARAYVVADPGGSALIAIFAGGADEAWIDS